MRVAVAREEIPGETRVSVVPGSVSTLVALGYEVLVEPGAGQHAHFPDQEYAEAGATVHPEALAHADVVLSVQALEVSQLGLLAPGTALISFLPQTEAHAQAEWLAQLQAGQLTAFGLDLVPRSGRAQAIDALTSQATVAGYRAAIVAAGMLREFVPLQMTAAGTEGAARILVLGTGITGLQAMATLRRLGAEVLGFDVRADAVGQIQSVGATALDVAMPPLSEQDAYYRRLSKPQLAVVQQALTAHVESVDAVIAAAAVPGEAAPVLIPRAMAERMKPGAVIVDVAAEFGGNVEGSHPGKMVRIGGTQVWGGVNLPAQMPGPASRLLSTNIVNLMTLLTHRDERGRRRGIFAPDFEDDLVAATCISFGGELVQSSLAVGGES